MEEQPTEKKEENKRRLHVIYLSIIFLLTGLCIFLAFNYRQLQVVVATHEIKIEEVVKQNNDVTSDLNELKEQYAQLKTNNKGLSAELDKKRAMIDSLLEQAQKHKNDPYIISRLKKETVTLRVIMQGYVREIDSLNQLNGKLIADKNEALNQLGEEKQHSQQVEAEKEQLKNRVDRAAILTTLNIKAVGVRYSRGGKHESETAKASKADKIKITFDVAENKLTVPGPKDIYIRVMTPDGQEMTQSKDAEHQFSFGGNTGYFAAKKTIDYEDQPMSVLIYCDKPKSEDKFVPGKYIIEINADKVTIGTTTMTLE